MNFTKWKVNLLLRLQSNFLYFSYLIIFSFKFIFHFKSLFFKHMKQFVFFLSISWFGLKLTCKSLKTVKFTEKVFFLSSFSFFAALISKTTFINFWKKGKCACIEKKQQKWNEVVKKQGNFKSFFASIVANFF